MSETDDFSEDVAYVLSSEDNCIVSATKQLLCKTAKSEIITARGLEVVNRIVQVFEALPSVVADLDLQLQVTGPSRTFGSHEIHHWWNIEVENGSLCVTSGGYFYRPETGGDSFTSMIWRAFPGFETEHNDYTDTLSIVDDAQPFDLEVQEIDFAKGGYSLTVFENGEELEDDSSDEDDEDEDGTPDLHDRIIQALKKTWDVLNPGGRNLYIAPTTDTMLWIASYGGDDEAASAYLAMSEGEKLKFVYEVFPAYYPK